MPQFHCVFRYAKSNVDAETLVRSVGEANDSLYEGSEIMIAGKLTSFDLVGDVTLEAHSRQGPIRHCLPPDLLVGPPLPPDLPTTKDDSLEQK